MSQLIKCNSRKGTSKIVRDAEFTSPNTLIMKLIPGYIISVSIKGYDLSNSTQQQLILLPTHCKFHLKALSHRRPAIYKNIAKNENLTAGCGSKCFAINVSICQSESRWWAMTLLPNRREQKSILFHSRYKSQATELPFSISTIANNFKNQMWYLPGFFFFLLLL